MSNIEESEKSDETLEKLYLSVEDEVYEDDEEEDEEDEQSLGGQFSKSWDELTFSDNFLFCKIMEDEDICKRLLEILLPIKIEKIKYLSTEKRVLSFL